MLSRRLTWAEVRVAVTATLVFALGVLSASRIHLTLFSATNPTTWIWFGGFSLTTVMLGSLAIRSMRIGNST